MPESITQEKNLHKEYEQIVRTIIKNSSLSSMTRKDPE